MKSPALVYVRWKDAMSSSSEHPLSSLGDLAELHEVGFLLQESDTTITVGTESQDNAVSVRFWLTIPKANIIDIRRTTLGRAFPKARKIPKKEVTTE